MSPILSTARAAVLLSCALFTLPAFAADYAAMDEVPVGGGELRLATPVDLESVDRNATAAAGFEPSASGKVIAFPLERTGVTIDVAGPMAEVTVEQTFGNPFDVPLEAVYVFPLGDEAAVNAYEIDIGERTIRGIIKTREEARETYETAKERGHTAALLEQEKPNVFSQSVANIPPGEAVTVRLTYVELLDYDGGDWELVFPMVVGPRYLPEHDRGRRPIGAHAAGSNPKTSVSVPYVESDPDHVVEVEVHLDPGVPVSDVVSPSHAIEQKRVDATTVDVWLAPHDRAANRDLVLRWNVAGDKTMVGVLTDRRDDEGFFTLVIQPKADYREGDITGREMVIVIDRSGSMGGVPLDQAKAVARGLLSTLGPRDSFNLVAFADGIDTLSGSAVSADDAGKSRGLRWLDRLSAGGGTEMRRGVLSALGRKPGDDQVRMIYVLSDGYVGNDDSVLGAAQDSRGNNRIFPIGIGSSPNRYLLDRLAEVGRGFPSYVLDGEDPAAVLEKLVRRTSHPYLTDVEIDWGSLRVDEVTPARLPDVYAGQPLVVSGRYQRPGESEIRVKANVAGRPVVTPLTVELPKHADRPGVSYLWARRRIHELMGKQYGSVSADVKKEVTRLGLEFHLVTDFTSFVAVDESRVVDASGRSKTVRQPVPTPRSVGFEQAVGAPPPHNYTSRRRGPRLRMPSGGGGDLDPITLITLLVAGPLARRLRARRRARLEAETTDASDAARTSGPEIETTVEPEA